MKNEIDPKAVAAAVKAKLTKQKTYDKYDYEAKYEEYTEALEARNKADETLREIREDINGYLAFGGYPLLDDSGMTITTAELIKKLGEVLENEFPSGANGKEIAAKIGHGVTSNDIAAFYNTDGQSTLKKAKDAKTGKVLTGLKTRYLLATKDDLEEINKAKAQEKADRDAAKAEREAKQSK